jgi:hypothetical protein
MIYLSFSHYRPHVFRPFVFASKQETNETYPTNLGAQQTEESFEGHP